MNTRNKNTILAFFFEISGYPLFLIRIIKANEAFLPRTALSVQPCNLLCD